MAAHVADSPAKVRLLDGALGTELGRRGVETRGALFSAASLLDERGRAALREVHRAYVDAGAEVITAATFRPSRRSLSAAGLEARFPELPRLAVREAREAASGRARVAGSIAPLEDCYRPDLRQSPAQASREHLEHARALAEAGRDRGAGVGRGHGHAAGNAARWRRPGRVLPPRRRRWSERRADQLHAARRRRSHAPRGRGVGRALRRVRASRRGGRGGPVGQGARSLPGGVRAARAPVGRARRDDRGRMLRHGSGAHPRGGPGGRRRRQSRTWKAPMTSKPVAAAFGGAAVFSAIVGGVALAAGGAQKVGAMDVEKLLAERAEMLAAFKDPHRSPYAAVDRRDFQGAPLVLGSADDADLRLEGARPRHARIAVDGGAFRVEAIDEGATVEV